MAIYSNSRLGAFESCPRQYWFQYVGKPDIERVESVEAFLGSRVHDALEQLYRLLLGGRVMSRAELLQWYEDAWARQWNDEIRIVRSDLGLTDYLNAGQNCLSAYHERYAPFDQSRTLSLECRVLFDLDDLRQYRMQGYIDRLAQRPDGTYEVHDYKTSGHLVTQADADADRQLGLYQIGVMGMWSDVQNVDLIWHYLRFDKEISSRRTPDQLQALRTACIALIDDIEARGREEASFPTKPSSLCDWCDFRQICPAQKHYVAVEAMPPEEFKADDGVRLVDQWAETRGRRLALEKQAGELKTEEQHVQEQLIAYARQEGIESVAGSGHHVDISEVVNVDYPKSGDERREEFEGIIRGLGLWDQVSGLKGGKVKELWLTPGGLSPEAQNALGQFLTRTVQSRAKLKKGGGQEE